MAEEMKQEDRLGSCNGFDFPAKSGAGQVISDGVVTVKYVCLSVCFSVADANIVKKQKKLRTHFRLGRYNGQFTFKLDFEQGCFIINLCPEPSISNNR